MKIYLAARTRHTQMLILLAKFLKGEGHEITSDWIYVTDKLKPFGDNLYRVREISDHNLQMMTETDCLILFNDLGGTDLFSEFGICLANKKLHNPNMKIYIVGKYEDATILQLGSLVEHFSTLGQVLTELNVIITPEIRELSFE